MARTEFMPGWFIEEGDFGITTIVTTSDHGSLAGLGDDDHTQYAQHAAIETISAVWTHAAQIAASGAPNVGVSGARFGTGFFTVIDTSGAATIGGDLDHNGSNIGFFGVVPAARAAAYTPTNVTTDRSYDADTVVIAELADVVGTLIADLKTYGLLQ